MIREGDVILRMHNGQTVAHHPISQRYYCLAYPCPATTVLFHLPRNSHLCYECIEKRRNNGS